MEYTEDNTQEKKKKWIPWVIAGGLLIVIIGVISIFALIFIPAALKYSSRAPDEKTASLDLNQIFENDTHIDYQEWEDYEFDDSGIVIGQTIFRSTKDGVVYVVVHFAMDGPTEIYNYADNGETSEVQITWENGKTSKPFIAGKFVSKNQVVE